MWLPQSEAAVRRLPAVPRTGHVQVRSQVDDSAVPAAARHAPVHSQDGGPARPGPEQLCSQVVHSEAAAGSSGLLQVQQAQGGLPAVPSGPLSGSQVPAADEMPGMLAVPSADVPPGGGQVQGRGAVGRRGATLLGAAQLQGIRHGLTPPGRVRESYQYFQELFIRTSLENEHYRASPQILC